MNMLSNSTQKILFSSTAWTPGQDAILINGIKCLGRNWAQISKDMFLSTKSSRQCRDRYFKIQSPRSNQGFVQWTKEEDDILIQVFNLHGNNWKLISKSLSGRSAAVCLLRATSLGLTLDDREAPKKRKAKEEEDYLDSTSIFLNEPLFKKQRLVDPKTLSLLDVEKINNDFFKLFFQQYPCQR